MPNVTTDARSDLHGHAVLYPAASQDISNNYSPSGSTSLPLGYNDGDRNHGYAFSLDGGDTPGHQLWFGATRSGKGVSGIIPALLTTRSSVVAVDPKGELAWITAKRRRELGHRTVILDPWNEVNERYAAQVEGGELEVITKFNPLSALDPTSRTFNDDVSAIADALVISDPNDPQSHWINSARSVIAGLIAAAVEAEPGKASLRRVRELITASDQELLTEINRLSELDDKPASDHLGLPGAVDVTAPSPKRRRSLAARKLRRFAKKDLKTGEAIVTEEIQSIRSTAETQTDLLDSEDLIDSMETDSSPFNLEDLMGSNVTVYLVLPPDKLMTHGRWLRLILTMALRVIARQRKPPALPVLFILDEMGTIGNLSMIEASYGLLAGLGVRLAGYLQDLSQLQRDYPRNWQTFWSNSSVIGILQCHDDLTAEHVSRFLGTKTVEVNQGYSPHTRPLTDAPDPNKQHSAFKTVLQQTADSMGAAGGVSTSTKKEVWEPDLSFHPRQVLLPDEVRNLPDNKVLLLVPGKFNLLLNRYIYYSDPVFSTWARHDPNKPAPVVNRPPAPVVQHTAPASTQPKQPQSLRDNLDGQVSAATSAVGGFLKRKLEEKLSGK